MSDVARLTGGRLVGPDVDTSGASIDSRTLQAGQLFIPVVAERDGHDFIASALKAGASAYLTQREPAGGTAVVVDDTMDALASLGVHARRSLEDAQVLGVTGSVGKTTVKDLLAAILRADRPTWANERSFNNELGVPLTLINAPEGTAALVVEMGARGAGHIKDLCTVARPTTGIVTRVASVHTEQFGTLDDVAVAKAELVEALPASGFAVLNQSDHRVAAMAARTDAQVVTFHGDGEVRAEAVVLDDQLRPRFKLVSPWGAQDLWLPHARGVQMVENALAASAAALACGASLDNVAQGLEAATLSPWRMELLATKAGGLVLNDAYNANPTSMAAALRSLAALPARRRVAVLGLMAELGASSDEDHAAIGALAGELGIEVIAVEAPAYGGQEVADVEAAADVLGEIGEGVAVLVKGSRVAALERLAHHLTTG